VCEVFVCYVSVTRYKKRCILYYGYIYSCFHSCYGGMIEWLNAILRQAGVLREGEVVGVEREMMEAFNSHTGRLSLGYSADATPGVPTRLVLKQNVQADWGKEARMEEVKFYHHIASLREYPVFIVPCYGASYDPRSENSYVLLQDLSETHWPPVTRDQQISIVEGVPCGAHIEAVVDTLAQVHAHWWNHDTLEGDTFDIGYWSRNAEQFGHYLHQRRTVWEQLIRKEKAWFPDDLRELYEQRNEASRRTT